MAVTAVAVLALAACGDDDGAADPDAGGRRTTEHGTVDEALPSLLVEHVHLLSQATLAQVAPRPEQLAVAHGALAQNAAAVAAEVAPGSPGPVERAWMDHVDAYTAYTDAVMAGVAAGEEAAVARVEDTSDALLAAFEAAAPAAPEGSTTSTPGSTTGGAPTGGEEDGAAGQASAGTDQGDTVGGTDQGGTTGPEQADGGGGQMDRGDAVAGQGEADAGSDLGDAGTGAQDSEDGAAEGTATGLAGILQSHREGTLQTIDALVAGDLATAARLTAANAEAVERLAIALAGGVDAVDAGSLDLVAEHAEHPIVAGAVTDAVVHGRTAEHEAALVQAEANTLALLGQVRAVAADDADAFEELWRQHLDAYQAHATAATAGDTTATAAAQPALAAFVDGVAELIERWTRGAVPASDAAAELRRHVDGTLRTIDAQVAGDHPTVHRLTHEGVLRFAAFGSRLAAALEDADGAAE
jgi:hypothetical protein